MAKDEQLVREEKSSEKPGLVTRMIDGVKQAWEELRIGDGHLEAMWRLGLKELRNAFNPSRESVADAELGLYGTATQKEINADRSDGAAPQESLSMESLRADAQAKRQENERGKDGPEQERERDRSRGR